MITTLRSLNCQSLCKMISPFKCTRGYVSSKNFIAKYIKEKYIYRCELVNYLRYVKKNTVISYKFCPFFFFLFKRKASSLFYFLITFRGIGYHSSFFLFTFFTIFPFTVFLLIVVQTSYAHVTLSHLILEEYMILYMCFGGQYT